MKLFLFVLFFTTALPLFAQTYVARDIKSFGAKGDGKANDHDAFIKAADFFNKRGGNGKLIISKGTYLIGKQKLNKNIDSKPYNEGVNLLHFSGIKHFAIVGKNLPIIKYRPGLQFGTFVPATGKPSENGNNFFKISHAATIGNAIVLSDCNDIQITNIELNGNSPSINLGGIYGDVGRQLPHSGILIENSTNVVVSQIKAHHFGLDGMIISNATGNSKKKDSIVITKSFFEYNCRQGLSWVGGNDLTVTQSGFNHTGKGKFGSAPGAGVDIEAEVGTVSNGKFVNCEFINNTGCGVVADSGPSSDCLFVNCKFWGVTSWSIWAVKPRFTFDHCKIYGSVVHGYNSTNDNDATKFLSCLFEDLPFNGKEPYGKFLIEENYARRLRFENCTMRAHKKKVIWLGWSAEWKPEEKYQLVNCTLEYTGDNIPDGDWVGVFRNVRFTNTNIILSHPLAEKKKYWWSDVGESSNLFKGANNTMRIGKKIERY